MDGVYLEHDDGLIPMVNEGFSQEIDLQALLERHPDLLSGRHSGGGDRLEWLLIAREQGVPAAREAPDRWSADHLFVDGEGVPTIVEVKRSANTQIRREVVGQMLDYAANGVRYWPVERLQTDLAVRTGGAEHADAAVVDLLTRSGSEATPGEFWRRVEENLQAGRLRLLFVADSIPGSLQRIIEFLNEQMTQCEVLGIEIRQYVGGRQRVFAPTVIGRTSQARRTKRQSDTRTFDEYLAGAPDPVREIERRLQALATERGWEISTSQVARQYRQGGRTLLQLYPGIGDGLLQVMLAGIHDAGPAGVGADLLRELEVIVDMHLTTRQPRCPVQPLLDRWEQFTADWLPRYAAADAAVSAARDL